MVTARSAALLVAGGEQRSRTALLLELIALHHQIAVLKRSGTCLWRIDGLCRKSVIRHTQVEKGGETAVMSIWGGHTPVVVRVREPLSKLVQIRVAVGSALPIASAQGTIFLAWHRDTAVVRRLLEHLAPAQRAELMREIEFVRRHKVAISAQVVDGIRAVAVPVFDHETVAATLGFVSTTAAISADFDSGLVAALKEAATLLSRELGCAGGIEDDEHNQDARGSGGRSTFGIGHELK